MQTHVSDSDGLEMAWTAKWFAAIILSVVIGLAGTIFLCLWGDMAQEWIRVAIAAISRK